METTQFKAEQRDSWNEVSSGWEKWADALERSAREVSRKMLREARLAPGHRLLDVASGTGEPALEAARAVGADGRVTLTDMAPEMLAVARRRAEDRGIGNVNFVECDAETLDVSGGPFDAVTSRWGLMFLPRLELCLKRIASLLRPSGRLVAAVWGPPPSAPFLSLPVMTIMNALGVEPPPPGTPGIFGLADPEPLTSGLAELGFTEIEVGDAPVTFPFSSLAEYIEFLGDVASPIRAMLSGESEARRKELWTLVLTAAEEKKLVELPNQSLVISATAPVGVLDS